MAYVFPPPSFDSRSQTDSPSPGPPRFSTGAQRPRTPHPPFNQGGSFHSHQRASPKFHQRFPSPSQSHHPQHGRVFPPHGPNFRQQGPYTHHPQSSHQHQGPPGGTIRPLLPEQERIFPGHGHGRQQWKGAGGQHQKFVDRNRQVEKKKKPKKEKILPFYCESCERGFKTQEKLNEHNQEHVKCKGKDCKFEAHWKVVRIHYQNQHGPGSKKIGRLETPEEISKWREARKRLYPTIANMAKKREEGIRRQQSGQVLKTKTFGKMGRSNRGGNQQGERFQGGNVRGRQNKRFHPKDSTDISGESTTSPKKARLDMQDNNKDHVTKSHNLTSDPMSYILEDGESPDEVSNKVSPSQSTSDKVKKRSSSALGALAANYGSDSDQSEEENQDENKPMPSPPKERQNEGKPGTSQQLGRQGWKNKRQRGRNKKRGGNRQNDNGKEQVNRQVINGRKTKQTLLEMLLAPEIRHERNVILQCVRYLRRNNFFNVANKSTKLTSNSMKTDRIMDEQNMNGIKKTTNIDDTDDTVNEEMTRDAVCNANNDEKTEMFTSMEAKTACIEIDNVDGNATITSLSQQIKER
ncbi:FMR1-interacting protein NUFIP1-like [Glandiceps talaboti]